MDNSKNRQNELLGVNKMGKNIRKSPLHQPNFASSQNSSSSNNSNNNNNPNRQQPQPQVYNISKNDFRSIVQQLTGSPLRDPLPRPQNPPKPQSMRLQKIRPPPLTPMNRPHIPPPVQQPPVVQQPPPVPYNNSFAGHGQFVQPTSTFMPPISPGNSAWPNTAESPISAYMRYLSSSLIDPGMGGNQGHPALHPTPPHSQAAGHFQHQQPGLLPNPHMPSLPSPRFNSAGPPPPVPSYPSPQFNGPPFPSPTSQFLLPSPTGFMNLLSPRSPYPPLSPGMQFPPLTPNFSFSPFAQSGILGPGPQPPPSPGLMFPSSPSGFFPMSGPRWRNP